MILKPLLGLVNLFLLLIIILFTQNVFSQLTKEAKLSLKLIDNSFIDSSKRINYLRPLIVLKEQKRALKDVPYIYEQLENQYYSFVQKKEKDSLHVITELFPKKGNYKSATNKIIEIADHHNAIMFNESHIVPRHRLYFETLLKSLYDKGFKVLALETLDWKDTELNTRKFPISISGYYSREPNYANMIRTALEIGYKLFPYETRNHRATMAEREREQTENLKKILDSNKKILVLAGYDHIKEKADDSSNEWLAKVFYEKTNINPFTIEQTELKEVISINQISYYEYKDKIWLAEKFKGFYDMMLVYPNKENDTQLYSLLERPKLNFQLRSEKKDKIRLFQIFRLNEYKTYGNKAIPVAQQIIYKSSVDEVLFLKKGINNNILASKKIKFCKKIRTLKFEC